MLPSSHFFLSCIFINLTAIIKIVMSEVLTRILLHPHMLCQPLLRRVCSVALITNKLQLLHSQSENRNIRTIIVLPNFSVFSAFSLIVTAFSEVSPISTATLAAAHLSILPRLLAPTPHLGSGDLSS